MDCGGVQLQPRPLDVAGCDPPGLDPPSTSSSSDDKDDSRAFGSSGLEANNNNATTDDKLVTCSQDDYDAVLETIDSCVGCVEGVDRQNRFEEGLIQQSKQQSQVAAEHGLSQAEAAMIRMQISDTGGGITKMIGSTLPDLDILNFLGCEDLNDPQCGGLVSPTDTTVEHAGDRLMETDHSSRSLVDVAALDDPSIRAKTMTKLQCAICFDETGIEEDESGENAISNRIRFVYFPCCEPDEDDDSAHHSANAMNVCMSCILVLTTATTDGSARVGRCPRCRGWISASTMHSPNVGLSVQTLQGCEGKCDTCQEVNNPLVEQNPPTCDACFLGKRCSLSYECQDCHEVQTIPHPLYRCQETAESYGNTKWECHGKCKKPTNWKICKDQLSLIPAGDVPAKWGDDCLQLARARVKEARRGIAQFDLLDKQRSNHANDEGCVIL